MISSNCSTPLSEMTDHIATFIMCVCVVCVRVWVLVFLAALAISVRRSCIQQRAYMFFHMYFLSALLNATAMRAAGGGESGGLRQAVYFSHRNRRNTLTVWVNGSIFQGRAQRLYFSRPGLAFQGRPQSSRRKRPDRLAFSRSRLFEGSVPQIGIRGW